MLFPEVGCDRSAAGEDQIGVVNGLVVEVAANAALLAAQILATHDKELHQRLNDWRKAQTDEVLENPDPRGAA